MNKLLVVFGTRPEAIKMSPLIHEIKLNKKLELKVCVTGQHKEMLYQVLDLFDIAPDFNLDIMEPDQTLSDISSAILKKLDQVLDNFMPDIILVHGDTTTTLAASLSGYYKKIPIGHIEAGLRTGDIFSPWPEEGNRKITGAIAKYHFAPTSEAKNNLLKEGVSESCISVTGNTVIDALFWVKEKLKNDKELLKTLDSKFDYLDNNKRLILVTGHRRESFGDGFERICEALKEIAISNKNLQIVYPVHMNPNVQEPVNRMLDSLENIFLIKPLEYLSFYYLMEKSYLILTDSGGIQEEAPSLGKPVLVMRDTTERPEALSAGTVKLVGTNTKLIVDSITRLLNNKNEYKKMSQSNNPYGDGFASKKIVDFIINGD